MRSLILRSVVTCAAPVTNIKMTEPSKVLHIRNVGPEISEVRGPRLCVAVFRVVGQRQRMG